MNKGIFLKYQIVLACEDCVRAGKASECKHRKNEVPRWSNAARRDLVKLIYGKDREDQHARETMGLNKPVPNTCFDSEQLEKLFSNPRRSVPELVLPYVFMAIDPNGGSEKSATRISDFAVCTSIGPGFEILGLEAIDAAVPSDYETRLENHLKTVQKIPRLSHAKLIVSIEGNLAHEAYHISEFIKAKSPFLQTHFLGDMERKPGVKTTEKSKDELQRVFSTALGTEQISISSNFVTTHENPAELLKMAKHQLMKYAYVAVPGKTLFQETRWKFSGKGANKKEKDDVGIAIQLGCFWQLKFLHTSTFIRMHR